METKDASMKSALEQLTAAVTMLENAFDRRVEISVDQGHAEDEMQSMLSDRSRLAQELDQAQHRSNRLEEANREVSRRLVAAMETIRAVLDRAK